MSSLLETGQSTLKFFTRHQELIKASQGDNVIVIEYSVLGFGISLKSTFWILKFFWNLLFEF